jgi:molecular chaperone GrpE
MSAKKKIKVNIGKKDAGDDQNNDRPWAADDQPAERSPDAEKDAQPESDDVAVEVDEPETAEEISLSPEEIKELIREKEEQYDRLLRMQADFDNYRKRVQKEQANLLRYGAENALIEILPVVDNIQRAADSARVHEESNHQLREGVELILSQFLDTLKKLGVTPIEAVGHPFDPNKHDALLRVHAPDAEEGTVIEEIRKGYYLHDKVMRPAQVTVGTNEAIQEQGEETTGAG